MVIEIVAINGRSYFLYWIEVRLKWRNTVTHWSEILTYFQFILADNVGCYGRFPRSSLLRGFRDEIEWFKPPLKKQMDKVVAKCSRIAMKERLTFFAVEDYGNCYGTQEFLAGSEPKSTRCNFGVGLENFFYVYKVFLWFLKERP